MQNRVVITIPIHKDILSLNESISLKQCFSIFFNREIFLLAPVNLNIAQYVKLVPDINVIRVKSKWLSSIEMYNKFKLSNYFYSLFDSYEYILTYELDSFVFRDELDYWVEQGFDYIGAPWFEGWDKPNSTKLIGVGNSGFSLRKISTMKKAINEINFKPRDLVGFQKIKFKLYLKFFNIYKKIFNENILIQFAPSFNEDGFIFHTFKYLTFNFNISPEYQAIAFSFEVNPSYLYSLNRNTLPFGCHGWEKYEPKFWKPFIDEYSIKINT